MGWITKASNERNAARQQRDLLAQKAPALWDNICRDIEETVKEYGRSGGGEFIVESTGPANHTIWVWVFESKTPREKGPERERVTFSFNQEKLAVEVNSSLGTSKVFLIALNAAGNACLMDGNKEIPVDKFTEITLRDAFFPTSASG
jgi:hypothetical protein